MPSANSSLPDLLRKQQAAVLADWMSRQLQSLASRRDLISEESLRQESKEFLDAFIAALETTTNPDHPSGEAWNRLQDIVRSLSVSRARAGFSPSETATFVFSLKQPVFELIRRSFNGDDIARETWAATVALDRLGLSITEHYQKGREELILRQQQSMLELSTPVVTLWKGVLALPLIGTLDSERTQVVMESLLQRIVDSGAAIAILDITGVPTVDTLVAQHLLKTVAAARLMGADCIISGVRPQIAQTIVHLGVNLTDVITKATLADAFAIALARLGLGVSAKNGTSAKPVFKIADATAAPEA